MGRRVCIIGGGISGLTTAYLLKEKGRDVTLFEGAPQVGGNIRSEKKDGFLFEHGPNSLLRSQRLVDLIDRLSLRSEVLAAAPSAKKRYVLIDDNLHALPTGLISFVTGNFFSTRAKARLLKEPFIRTTSSGNESVAEFLERRLGKEVVEKAADPFISGIFAGDPQRLSMSMSFPALAGYEREYGSLLLGAIRSKREKADATFPRSFTFQNGLSTLTDRLQQLLGGNARTNCPIERIERQDGGFKVTTQAGEPASFDCVIISTKADAAGRALEEMDADLAKLLRSIRYAPVTVVRSAYPRSAVGHTAEGFGFLVPHSAGRRILGSLWTSSVFPDRAPDEMHLFTTFVGGARAAHLSGLPDAEITALVYSELAAILGISEPPVLSDLTRWEKAIPQYNIGYENIIDRLDQFTTANQGIFFCSNFYRGISVGDCVKNAYRTADDVETFLARIQ
jgi:protoporphyrinogen/coproporphyrinogen III oxidase